MAHWGWYWKIKKKHKPKVLCSQSTPLDSFSLFKHELFRQTGTMSFTISELQLEANLKDDHILVVYGKLKRSSYKIPVEKQACNYGGGCYYFRCPLCQKRMRFLYCSYGEFLCRKCLNLGYRTQRLRPSGRYQLKLAEIEKILEEKGGDLHSRPKWMRRRTFQKLQSCYWEYEEKFDDAYRNELLSDYPSKKDQILQLF